MPQAKSALVIVHGVGARTPGAMLRELTGELAGPDETRILSGHEFHRVTLPRDSKFDVAYECFYADLKPGLRNGFDAARQPILRQLFSVFDAILYPFRLLLVLSHAGAYGWHGDPQGVNEPALFGTLLHVLLWGLLFTLSIFFSATMHTVFSGALPAPGYVVALLTALPAFLIALGLRNSDRVVWAAVFLAPIYFILGLTLGQSEPLAAPRVVAHVLSVVQVVAVSLLTLAVLEVSLRAILARDRGCKVSFSSWLVRCAGLILPYTLIGGGFGAFAWATNMSLYFNENDPAPFIDTWGAGYGNALGYDAALMEFVYACGTASFALFVALGSIIFSIGLMRSRGSGAQKSWGGFVRDWLRASLILLVVIMIGVGTLYALSSSFHLETRSIPFLGPTLQSMRDAIMCALVGWIWPSDPPSIADNSAIFAIYAASATRLLFFIPFLIGPLGLIAMTAADVLMYVSPRQSTSYGAAARARFRVLLSALRTEGYGENIVIMAYSQGTVVVLDALGEEKDGSVHLMTAGSPIDTLYARFLKRRTEHRPACLASWSNFFRGSDFIGGPVALAPSNVKVVSDFSRHHLKYFHAPEIAAALAERD